MKILFARFFPTQDTFIVEHTAAIARYLSAKGHYVCFGGQDTDWSSFDAVYFNEGVRKDESEWPWFDQVDQLVDSCNDKFPGQQRWVTNCDPVISPKSLLLQLGMAATAVDEYTHVLRLPGQPTMPWPRNEQFTKYQHYAAKLDNCRAIVGNWWLYPDVAKLLKYRRDIVQPADLLVYSGWPKGDRLQALASLRVSSVLCNSYNEFASLHGSSTAAVVLSSPEHYGAATLRWSEVIVLTVCVAGPGYVMKGWSPSFVANNKAEADEILDHLAGLSRQGRQYLLDDQLDTLRNLQVNCEDIMYA